MILCRLRPRESRLEALLRISTVCERSYKNLWEIPLCVELAILRPAVTMRAHVTSRTLVENVRIQSLNEHFDWIAID